MENNDILARFHEINYQDSLRNSSANGSILREEGSRINRQELGATASAKKRVCQYNLFRRTSLCS